ncbi:MAG: helix-turn-helix domain-containing protein [Oscillospiraceae bacterium]|nr:helix-turn-helix domain-containing protein [Oscillospiraceae bacterium]
MDEINQCIKKAAEILDRTAGVISTQGVIVAATDASLNGQEDQQGLGLLSSEDSLLIGDQRSYKKLVLDGQAEYSVFIDGTDQVSQTYLELLSNWILTALAEDSTDSERENLLKNILLENELPGDIPLKAREFKIPYAALRVCYLIHIEEGDSLSCLETLRGMFPRRKQDFLLAMDEDTVVLLKEINRSEKDNIEALGVQVLDTLNAESMAKVRIGIGMPAETLKDCAKSYREASLSLTVGSIFENESYLMRYDKLGLGRLIYQLPPTLCHMFLDEVFPDGCYDQLDSETLLTIQKFFENNLNGSETSRQLFVHRNTLVYRLDKVQKITNLDLRNFDDAVLFKLASMVRMYLEKQDGSSLASKNSNKWWRN